MYVYIQAVNQIYVRPIKENKNSVQHGNKNETLELVVKWINRFCDQRTHEFNATNMLHATYYYQPFYIILKRYYMRKSLN